MSSIRLDFPLLEQSAEAAAGRDELAARRAAMEFEALLLAQFTAALNPSADDEDGNLFGSSATDFYRQMFSEQMATVMAQSGGIGLAEVLLHQLRAHRSEPSAEAKGLETFSPPDIQRAIEAARLVRGEAITSADGDSSEIVQQAESLLLPSQRTDRGSHQQADPVTLQMPVLGRVSSRFGARRDPIGGVRRSHRGVDIAARRGTPIAAAAPGTVVFAGRQRGYGNLVVIEHADGRRTRYAHADRLLVARGDLVEAGQTIATVGSTGRATGPHLHFEVVEDERRVDPLNAVANDFTLARR